MIVCKNCLQEIEAHEGHQAHKKVDYDDNVEIVQGYYDENGNFVVAENNTEEYIFCEWCEEYELINDMYII